MSPFWPKALVVLPVLAFLIHFLLLLCCLYQECQTDLGPGATNGILLCHTGRVG